MSAPMQAAIERELGAQVKTFSSVRKALLWYRDQLAARLRTSRDPSDVSVRLSVAEREVSRMTFAVIALCTKPVHASDVGGEDEREEIAASMRGECVAWLLASYEARWGDLTLLSERAGMTRWAFTRRIARTERYLSKRLRAAGLLTSSYRA